MPVCRVPSAALTGELLISNNAAPEAKSTFVGGEALLQLCCTPCQEKALEAILEAIGTNISNCHWVFVKQFLAKELVEVKNFTKQIHRIWKISI